MEKKEIVTRIRSEGRRSLSILKKIKRANSSRDKNSHTPFADTRSGVVNVCIDRRDLIEHTNTRTLRQFHEGNIT